MHACVIVKLMLILKKEKGLLICGRFGGGPGTQCMSLLYCLKKAVAETQEQTQPPWKKACNNNDYWRRVTNCLSSQCRATIAQPENKWWINKVAWDWPRRAICEAVAFVSAWANGLLLVSQKKRPHTEWSVWTKAASTSIAHVRTPEEKGKLTKNTWKSHNTFCGFFWWILLTWKVKSARIAPFCSAAPSAPWEPRWKFWERGKKRKHRAAGWWQQQRGVKLDFIKDGGTKRLPDCCCKCLCAYSERFSTFVSNTYCFTRRAKLAGVKLLVCATHTNIQYRWFQLWFLYFSALLRAVFLPDSNLM